MSTYTTDDGFEFECDFCIRKLEPYKGDWSAAWKAAKADGWRASKDATGVWCHRCPNCADDQHEDLVPCA